MIFQLQPEYKDKELWLELAKQENMTFEVLDFSMPRNKDTDKKMFDWYEKTSLVTSIHGNFIGIDPGSAETSVAKLSLSLMQESILLAKNLGAENVVFHSSCESFLRGPYIKEWSKRVADCFMHLASDFDGKIYIENSMDVDPEPILQVLSKIDSDNIKICLDIGHVNYSREPVQVWIDALGDYIEYIHLSDNMGLFDDHLILGDGIVPWELIDNIIKSNLDSPIFTLETGSINKTKTSLEYLKIKKILLPNTWNKISSERKKYNLSPKAKSIIKEKKKIARYETYQDKERRFNDILSKYLSHEIADHILSQPEDISLGGSKRNVTMLMSDIHGFTAISETLPANKLISLLNIYFTEMTKIVKKHGGIIIDMIGDGMLVCFGMFGSVGNHADQAVACAVEMQHSMSRVNNLNAKNNLPKIHMGIGINTGDVVVGNIGSEHHLKFGIVGRPINLTSRIESYTHNGQILISKNTKEACVCDLKIAYEGTVYPKGVVGSLMVYHIIGIGEPYNFTCWSDTAPYTDLKTPYNTSFSIIYSKHKDPTVYNANIYSISADGLYMKSDSPLDFGDTIQLDIGTHLNGKVSGQKNDLYHIMYTYIPGNFESWMHEICDMNIL